MSLRFFSIHSPISRIENKFIEQNGTSGHVPNPSNPLPKVKRNLTRHRLPAGLSSLSPALRLARTSDPMGCGGLAMSCFTQEVRQKHLKQIKAVERGKQ